MCMPHPFSLVRMGPPTAATRISDGSKTPSRDCMRGIPHIKNLLYQAGGSHTKKRRCNESVVGTFGSRRHGERHQRSERHEYGGEAPHGWRGQGWGGGRPAATNGLHTSQISKHCIAAVVGAFRGPRAGTSACAAQRASWRRGAGGSAHRKCRSPAGRPVGRPVGRAPRGLSTCRASSAIETFKRKKSRHCPTAGSTAAVFVRDRTRRPALTPRPLPRRRPRRGDVAHARHSRARAAPPAINAGDDGL